MHVVAAVKVAASFASSAPPSAAPGDDDLRGSPVTAPTAPTKYGSSEVAAVLEARRDSFSQIDARSRRAPKPRDVGVESCREGA